MRGRIREKTRVDSDSDLWTTKHRPLHLSDIAAPRVPVEFLTRVLHSYKKAVPDETEAKRSGPPIHRKVLTAPRAGKAETKTHKRERCVDKGRIEVDEGQETAGGEKEEKEEAAVEEEETGKREADDDKKVTLPHLMFVGRPGTCKTSLALAFANDLYERPSLENPFVLCLNASSDRGIETVRNEIMQFARTEGPDSRSGRFPPFKLLILDEVDSTTASFQTALQTLMETASFDTRFILLCNSVEPMIDSILSRCAVLHFPSMTTHEASLPLLSIAHAEQFQLSHEVCGFGLGLVFVPFFPRSLAIPAPKKHKSCFLRLYIQNFDLFSCAQTCVASHAAQSCANFYFCPVMCARMYVCVACNRGATSAGCTTTIKISQW